MSKRFNNGSHYENHRRAAELHEQAAHAHRLAEAGYGKQSRETGHEHSKLALEHSVRAFVHSQEMKQKEANAHGIAPFGHDEIAGLAYDLWSARGYPEGSPDDDWFNAAELIRSRAAGGDK